uniref:Uncharacterized protein n=1 Tax=Arion vulgaris TaxID=1028688 RepID=A0A0B6Z0F2_9EUPU
MSGYYYRVTPEVATSQGYGFRKVCKSEIKEIVARLSKHTYNSRVDSQEPHKTHNYNNLNTTLPPRTPTFCTRLAKDHASGNMDVTRKLTEQELQRLLRRIQKPTRSHLLSRNEYAISYHGISIETPTKTLRPSTSNERERALQHLSRPTTASKAKHAMECYLCHDDDREMNKSLVPFEYMYANDKQVTNDEINCIVSRLGSSTRASDRGSTICDRLSPDYESVHAQSLHLPLVSGLARSRSVAEIVGRLYSNPGNNRRKHFHGYSAMTTQLTDHTKA